MVRVGALVCAFLLLRPAWGDTEKPLSRLYDLSDRNGPVSRFAYETATRKVTEIVRNRGLDIKSASAGPGAIVYEQFGTIH